MKTFDQFEIRIINKIVSEEGLGRNVVNILDEFLEKTCVNIDMTTRAVNLKFEIQGTQPTKYETNWIINKKLPELQVQIIKILNLINYLEKNGFITTFTASNDPQTNIQFGPCAVILDSVDYSFPDLKTNDLLIEYVEKEIMPSPDLAEFTKNNYLTKDELRYRNQKFATWFGISISIIVGIFSIWVGIDSIRQGQADKEKNVIYENKIINYLKQDSIDQKVIIKEIDLLNYKFNNDTILVKSIK